MCVARDTLRPMYKLNSVFPFIIYDRTSSSELGVFFFFFTPRKLFFFFHYSLDGIRDIRTLHAAVQSNVLQYVKSLWQEKSFAYTGYVRNYSRKRHHPRQPCAHYIIIMYTCDNVLFDGYIDCHRSVHRSASIPTTSGCTGYRTVK